MSRAPRAGEVFNESTIADSIREAARRTGPALEPMYRFMLSLVPEAKKYPRIQKLPLGDRNQSNAMDVLEWRVGATNTKDRARLLAQAKLGIEKIRVQCRLATNRLHADARPRAEQVDEVEVAFHGLISQEFQGALQVGDDAL